MRSGSADRASGGRPFRARVAASYQLTLPALGLDGLPVHMVSSIAKLGESTHMAWTPRDGTPVGLPGSTLIIAHSNHSGYGAFNHLYQLDKGNRFTVTRGGKAYHYQVAKAPRFVRHISSNLMATMTQSGGRSTVYLVTCALNHYDWKHHRYTGWTVVKAYRHTK